MVRNRARRTDRGPSQDVIEAAAKLVLEQNFSVRAAAKAHNVCHVTLKRFMDKKKKNVSVVMGYKPHNKVFSAEMEAELTVYIKSCAGIFYGLTPKEVKQFAFRYALKNNCKMPENWLDTEMAGRDWFTSFLKRNPTLAIRSPESTSLSRAMNFNRENVSMYFENLSKIMVDYKFEPQDIYNLDETGINTAPNPGKIVAKKGCKQVGGINSHERGTLITMCLAVNAIGNSIPPMFIFPRKNYHSHFVNNGPAGCIGAANGSGWMQAEQFLQFLAHFIKFAKPTLDKKVLLIADNHDSHIQMAVIDFCRNNGIVLLSFPPHTSHKLQPLDRTVFGPFKKYFNDAADDWRKNNPGERLNIYHLPGLAAKALPLAATPNNIKNGFKCTGIYPFDRLVFSDEDYLPACVTDQPEPTTSIGTQVDQHDENIEMSFDTVDLPAEKTAQDSRGEETSLIQPKSPQPSTSSGAVYVSPCDIKPLPLAKPKMKKVNRRTKKSSIWTSTPVKKQLEEELEMKSRSKSKQEKHSKRLFVENEHVKNRGKVELTKKKLNQGKLSKNLLSDEEIEKKKIKKSKTNKREPSESSSEDDDDCFCLICLELWSQSKPNENWVKCLSCKKWSHESCTKGDSIYYICHNCESD